MVLETSDLWVWDVATMTGWERLGSFLVKYARDRYVIGQSKPFPEDVFIAERLEKLLTIISRVPVLEIPLGVTRYVGLLDAQGHFGYYQPLADAVAAARKKLTAKKTSRDVSLAPTLAWPSNEYVDVWVYENNVWLWVGNQHRALASATGPLDMTLPVAEALLGLGYAYVGFERPDGTFVYAQHSQSSGDTVWT